MLRGRGRLAWHMLSPICPRNSALGENERQKKNMENVKQPLFLGMDEVLSIVDAILAKQEGPKQWASINHIGLIGRLAILAVERASKMQLNEEQTRLFVCRTLDQHGIGGNSSQFRQYLQSEKGGSRLAKETSRVKGDY